MIHGMHNLADYNLATEWENFSHVGGQISTKDKGTAASSHVKEKSKSTASRPVTVQKEDRVSTTVGQETETKGAKAAGKGQHGYNFLSSYVTIFKKKNVHANS